MFWVYVTEFPQPSVYSQVLVIVPPLHTSALPDSVPATVPIPSQLSVQSRSAKGETRSEQVNVSSAGGFGKTGGSVSSNEIVMLSKSQHSARQSIAFTLFPTTGAVPIAGI